MESINGNAKNSNAYVQYVDLWGSFPKQLSAAYEMLRFSVGENGISNLHELVQKTFGLPYQKIRDAIAFPKCDENSENIGAITGLFFEQLIVSILVPLVRESVADVKVERNRCTIEKVSRISRDPDLHFYALDRSVVIELKVSPKRRELEDVIQRRKKCEEIGVHLFLIGGYVSANTELLELCSSDWCCFFEGSTSNRESLKEYSIDVLLLRNVALLNFATIEPDGARF